jgi:redox-sensitive bicupin YhaK (pirin superfamily)
MKVVTGKVVAGQIVIEGEPLEEGATVTVLAPERDETFTLDAQAETALLVAMAEADRGEVVSGEELLRKLRGGA